MVVKLYGDDIPRRNLKGARRVSKERAYRNARGVFAREVAQRLGVSVQTVYTWEWGSRNRNEAWKSKYRETVDQIARDKRAARRAARKALVAAGVKLKREGIPPRA